MIGKLERVPLREVWKHEASESAVSTETDLAAEDAHERQSERRALGHEQLTPVPRRGKPSRALPLIRD